MPGEEIASRQHLATLGLQVQKLDDTVASRDAERFRRDPEQDRAGRRTAGMTGGDPGAMQDQPPARPEGERVGPRMQRSNLVVNGTRGSRPVEM